MKIKPFKPKVYPESGNIHVRKRVKFGIDPTGDRLHLGHLVPLLVVKNLKTQKKEIRIIIGTFTATLGDPSGQNKTRPILSPALVQINGGILRTQIKKILGEVIMVDNHSAAAHMNTDYFISDIASKFSVQELMERANFKDRIISLPEILVPLMQALDSVLYNAEIEVGGEDQELNFKITRKLQESMGKVPQVCLLTPIISGTDGKKMSKSANNCIYVDEPKEIITEKILRIPDSVMDEWLPLFTQKTEAPDDPRERKQFLADEILSHL